MGVLDNIAALKAGYDVGQSVFGQDDASKDRALKDRALGLETAMRVKQLEDSQAYQQGQLANDQRRIDVAEQQGVMSNMLGWGGIKAQRDNAQLHADVTREGQKNNYDLGVMQNALGYANVGAHRYATDVNAELQQRELDIRKKVADGTLSYQEAQVELERARNSIAQQNANSTRDYYGAMGKNLDARTAGLNDELDRQKAFAKRRNNIVKALTHGGIYDIPEGPERDEVLSAFTLGRSPELANDVRLISSIKPGGEPSPEQREAVSRVVQSYIDRNVGSKDKDGNEVIPGGKFNSFQPAPSGDGAATMMIEVRKRRPDGSEFTEIRPVTEGRVSQDQDGKPLKLKPQDIGNFVLGLRSLGEFGEANPEARQEMDDVVEAYNNSTDEVSFNKYVHERQRQRAIAAKDQARVEKINMKEIAGARASSVSRAEKILNQVAPFDAESFMMDGRLTPEGQQRAAARQKILQTISEDIAGRPLEDLYNRPVDVYFDNPVIRKAIDEYNGLGAEKDQKSPVGRTFVNPRSQGMSGAAGGRPSPLAQAAPNGGGGFAPASYPHVDNAGGVLQAHLIQGKSQDHISHLRGPFAERLAAMLQDAPGSVKIKSGYRSPERQAQIFAGSDKSGHRVAHPGHSNHNHGLAADLEYASPKVKKWVHDNAARYGLTFRMPWEPWHIEPAGAGPDARNWGI